MELIALDYSPWSRKARWALDHHGVDYDYVEYLPMLGTPYLHAKAGRWLGPVSVPLLVQEGGKVLRDSYAIARLADARGDASLRVEESRGWNEASERVLSAGRALTAAAVLADESAQEESLPAMIPEGLRPMMRPVARVGARYLARKYGFTTVGLSGYRKTLHRELMGLRQALEERDYLLGDFSYADAAMALALQFVRPVEGWIELGPSSRRCWTQEELAEEFDELLRWRDRIFEAHAPWARASAR